jgi:hypothetical protein
MHLNLNTILGDSEVKFSYIYNFIVLAEEDTCMV